MHAIASVHLDLMRLGVNMIDAGITCRVMLQLFVKESRSIVTLYFNVMLILTS